MSLTSHSLSPKSYRNSLKVATSPLSRIFRSLDGMDTMQVYGTCRAGSTPAGTAIVALVAQRKGHQPPKLG